MDAGTPSSASDINSRHDEGLPSGASLLDVIQRELVLKSALLDSMLDGIIAHTLDGQVVYVNEPACKMYGFTQEEFLSLQPWGWVREPMRHDVDERIHAMREHGVLVFESIGPTRGDGAMMHTEIHARVVTIPYNGEIAVAVIRDVTERFAVAEKMRHLAFHDQLTGLANRPNFEERLGHALNDANRHNDVVGVVFLDLDDFKPINDGLGHACGDKVLKIIAERLTACVRDSDTVARMGGDEFIFLFPRLKAANDLAVVAKSVVDCVSAPMTIDGVELRIGASVGLAINQPGEVTDELIARADRAMYRAKLNGLLGWEEFLRRV